MIVNTRSIIIALGRDVKPWAQIGCSERIFYRVLSGRRVTRENALPFITAAQGLFGVDVSGVEIGGEIHFAAETVAAFRSRITELEAENARLRADNQTLSRIAYRRILSSGYEQN